MAAQHTVFRLKHRNGFDGLYQQQEDIPKVTKHEVLIKVRAVSLNFRDIAIITSKYPFPVTDNVVPCSDMAGDIEEIGECVKGLSVGDKAVASFDITNFYGPQRDWDNGQGGPIDGVLRQYVVLPASAVVKVPSDAPQTYSQLASVVCTGTTVWNSLYGNLPLRPGHVVLCQGAYSSVVFIHYIYTNVSQVPVVSQLLLPFSQRQQVLRSLSRLLVMRS